MHSHKAISVPAFGRFSGSTLILTLWLLGLAAPLRTPISAQETAGPQVVYAAAPEWPSLNAKEAEQPHKEIVLVKVEVDGFGNVVDTKLLTHRSVYSSSAVHAAWLWKFAEPVGVGPNPSKLNGMKVTLKFTFEILPTGTSTYETGTGFIPPYEVYLGRLASPKQ